MDKAHTIVDENNIEDFPELKKYWNQRFRYSQNTLKESNLTTICGFQ